jgi:hypothetical protein
MLLTVLLCKSYSVVWSLYCVSRDVPRVDVTTQGTNQIICIILYLMLFVITSTAQRAAQHTRRDTSRSTAYPLVREWNFNRSARAWLRGHRACHHRSSCTTSVVVGVPQAQDSSGVVHHQLSELLLHVAGRAPLCAEALPQLRGKQRHGGLEGRALPPLAAVTQPLRPPRRAARISTGGGARGGVTISVRRGARNDSQSRCAAVHATIVNLGAPRCTQR